MNANILVVEDHPAARRMMRLALESAGYAVDEAGDVRTAVTRLCASLPGLLVVDLVLPDGSGLDLVHSLRALPGGARVPVLAVTGLDSQCDAVSAMREIAEVLEKPVETTVLVARVDRLLGATDDFDSRARRILVVDDDPVERHLTGILLREHGFEVSTANDGAEAIEVAHARLPDAIVSDVLMPISDGFSLCQRVRTDATLRAIPVVLVSSHYDDPSDRELALKCGANAFVARTPNATPMIVALRGALLEHAPRHVEGDIQGAHVVALTRQLEHQLEAKRALVEQQRLDASVMSVVDRVATIFACHTHFGRALENAFYTVLEGIDANIGAVLLSSDGTWSARTVIGADPCVLLDPEHGSLLQRCRTTSDRIDLSEDRDGRDFLEMLGAHAGCAIPLAGLGERVGVMIVASRAKLDPGMLEAARFAALHIGIAIALEQQKSQCRALMESPNGVFVLGPDGAIVDVNQTGGELLGLGRGAIVGRFLASFFSREYGEQVANVPFGGASVIAPLLLATGHRHLDLVRVPIEDSRGRVFVTARDVTKKIDAIEALASSEARYRSLVEVMPDVVWSGTSAHTLEVSDNVVEMFGVSKDDILARGAGAMFDRVHADDRPIVEAALGAFLVEGMPLDVEARVQHTDGHWLVVHSRGLRVREDHGERIADVLIADITQRRKLEEQLRLAQKMEAIARLSSGIAHDFNNILAVVLAMAEFVQDGFDPKDTRRDDVDEIVAAAQRGAALTRQLLAFSRRQILEPTIVDLDEAVASIHKMVSRLVGEDIDLVVHTTPEVGRVRIDVGQLEQVIMNMVINARDAMPGGGRLVIETANVEFDESYASTHPPMGPGRYVMLAVTDNGCGMDAETQRRVFEPFFTTKELGKGTGLGLSTTYGIVKQSGGFIWVYSELGFGTTFKVYLPRIDAEASREVPKVPCIERSADEVVLLVEDDEVVRESVKRMLVRGGYRVIAARDGEEALSLMDGQTTIDIVVSDVVMPGMNGLDIVREVQRRSPQTRALMMSGYTDHAIFANGEVPPGLNFINKPFSADALAAKLCELLGCCEGEKTQRIIADGIAQQLAG